MKPHSKISVIIPAYNEENYLANCLSSLKKQTFKDFEIIVVDNNSTDKTIEIAKKYKVRVIKEEKQGMTHAREKGYAQAKGEILASIDADSIASPTWVETINQTFKSQKESVVAITGSFIPPYKYFPNSIYTAFTFSFVYITKLLTGHTTLHGPNKAVRKNAWKKIKNDIHTDDKLVHEDIDLACHLAKIGEIKFIPSMKTTYSLRRLKKNPVYNLYEYTIRYFRTIRLHHVFFP